MPWIGHKSSSAHGEDILAAPSRKRQTGNLTVLARYALLFGVLLTLCFSSAVSGRAPENQPDIQVVVDMVQLNVAVTDDKGNYITGLSPDNFVVTEDGILENIATFAEGDESARTLDLPRRDDKSESLAPIPPRGSPQQPDNASRTLDSLVAGANVFILFDTSNYMYRGFVFAQDAISDFVRSLDSTAKIAFYSYSRDTARDALLTSDRSQVLRGVRSTVAGADAALYNA